MTSLRSRRLEVVSRVPVLSFARYFQAPTTQATSWLSLQFNVVMSRITLFMYFLLFEQNSR